MNYKKYTRDDLIQRLQSLEEEVRRMKTSRPEDGAERELLEFTLIERVKELRCHNRITELFSNPENSLEETLQAVTDIIPESWQIPSHCEACITLGSVAYKTPGFRRNKYILSENILINRQKAGQVEVCYRIKGLPPMTDIFLAEERDLLKTIAVRVGNYIEKFEKSESLARREEMYRNLVETVQDIIFELSSEGRVVYISPSVERISEYSCEELQGKRFLDFVFEEDRPLVERSFSNFARKVHSELECRFVTKSGKAHWVRTSSNAVVKDGQFMGAIGTFSDINTQKKLSLELLESEALYRSILTASPDTITITDLQGIVLFASSRSEELFAGGKAADFVGHSVFEFIDPLELDRAKANVLRMCQGDILGAEEYLGKRLDGNLVPLEINGDVIRDENGQPVKLIFAVRDISARKSLENKLRLAEVQYKRMVETINEAIYEVDNDGVIRYISPAIFKILGSKPAELTGRNFFELMCPEDIPAMLAARQALISAPAEMVTPYQYLEYRLFAKDQALHWVRSSAVPVIENGQITGMTGSLVDIHARKMTEISLDQSNRKFRGLFENMAQGVIYWNDDGEIIDMNEAARQLWGITSHSWKKVSIKEGRWSAIHEDGTEFNPEEIPFEIVKKTGRPVKNVVVGHFNAEKNDYIWMLENAHPEFKGDSSGAFSVVSTYTDITDQKRIELEIYRQKQYTESIIKALPDLMFVLNMNGEILEQRAGRDEDLAMPREMFLKRNITDILPPFICERISEGIRDIMNGTLPQPFEYNMAVGASVRDFEARMSPVGNDRILVMVSNITERKKAAEELKRSEALYSSILKASPDSIAITDLEGRILFASPKSLEIFGYDDIAEMVDHSVFEFIDEKEHAIARQRIEEMINGMNTGGIEYQAIKQDKRRFPVEVNGQLIRDDQGNPFRLVLITRNITNRKMLEEQLKKSEESFRNMIETINDALYEVDAAGIIKYVSPSVMRFLGYSPQELIGKNFFEYMFPEDRPVITRALRNLGKSDYSYLEYRYYAKNGEIRWVRSSTVPIYDQGVMVGGTGTLSDIHERKLAENATKLSEEKYRSLIESSDAAITMLDASGQYLFLNSIAAGPFGASPASMEGMNVRDLFPADQAESILADVAKVISSNEGIVVETKVDLAGTDQWFRTSIQPVRNAEGKPYAVLLYSTNTTKAKMAEEKMRYSEARLRQIAEVSQTVIWEVDAAGLYTYVSPLSESIWGYKPEELMCKMNLADLHPEKGRQEFIESLMEVAAQKQIFKDFVNPVMKKSGEIVWVSTDAVPVLDPEGNLLGYRGADNDITQRKLAEEALVRSEELLNTAQEVARMGSWEYVLNTGKFIASKNLISLLGLSSAEDASVRDIFIDMVWPEDRHLLEAHYDRVNQTNESSAAEFRIQLADGSTKWVLDRIVPLVDEDYGIVWRGVILDITQRKLDEQQILDLNANLENKIAERTLQLLESNENLIREIEDRKTVEKALKEKTTELEKFFSVALDLLCIADVTGRFIKVNQAWSKILGYDTSYLEEHNFLEFVHPDDMQATLDAMKQLSGQQMVINFINRYRCSDGSYRWIEWRSVPVGETIYAAARDISERKRTEDFELELLQLSSILTGISLDGIDNALNVSLERIGKFLETDRAYIFHINSDSGTMSNTYEWCNEGITAEKEHLQEIPVSIFPGWIAMLEDHKVIHIPSVRDLPENWQAVREILEPQAIQSLLVIPMFDENNLIGFVGLDSVKNLRDYSESDINILKVWSSMLSSLLVREKTEQLLESTRKNFEVFFNTIDDFLWVLDAKANIVHINNTVIERLGHQRQEIEGRNILMVHEENRREEAIDILGKILDGKLDHCPIPLMAKSGKVIPVDTRIKKGYWNGKEAIFGVSKDMSPIILSEQKFSKAFHSGSALIAISRFNDGVYLDINETFLETLGYSREEIIGSTNKALGLFLDITLRDKIIKALECNEPVRKLEVEVRSKDGELKTILLSADSIFVGQDRCLLTLAVDISDRKQAEASLKLAREEAEKANVAKSEFLSRMSHELRTPLNSILGFAQLLEMGGLNPGQKKGVDHIMHSGKHLLDLINEVLDISRIEAGRLSLSLEPVGVDEIIREMIGIVQPLAVEHDVTVTLLDTPEQNLWVRSDRQRTRQILINLLNNAVKYNKPKGSVSVKTERLPENNDGISFIKISVIDTGIGIKEDDIPKLFTPFERVGADKTQTEGTGLGLSVVKKLIDAMGGTLGVESTPGVGSTFWLTLPQTEGLMERITASGALDGLDPDQKARDGVVLYFEDNLPNIELVEQILSTQRPYLKLVTDTRGSEALELVKKYRPDLILLDLNLPDVHGSDILSWLRKDAEFRDIPVVIISADAMPQQLKRLKAMGAKEYLTKPLDISLFLKIIDKFIEQK